MEANKKDYDFLREKLLATDKKLLSLKKGQDTELMECIGELRSYAGNYDLKIMEQTTDLWAKFQVDSENENTKDTAFGNCISQSMGILSKFLSELTVKDSN